MGLAPGAAAQVDDGTLFDATYACHIRGKASEQQHACGAWGPGGGGGGAHLVAGVPLPLSGSFSCRARIVSMCPKMRNSCGIKELLIHM